MAAAKEISADVAIEHRFLSGLNGNLTLRGEQENSTEGFTEQTACFRFTPRWLWLEFCEIQQRRVASYRMVANIVPVGNLDPVRQI